MGHGRLNSGIFLFSADYSFFFANLISENPHSSLFPELRSKTNSFCFNKFTPFSVSYDRSKLLRSKPYLAVKTSSKRVEESISKSFSLERRENFQSFHGVSDDERHKMILSDTQVIFPPKQEGNSSYHQGKVDKPSSSSTPWIRLKDPRIVRVPRAFGGKDRHSKVCTIRGLRDRRVRLSVPTAIQLYDLQDRLGLSQPSKVVDWLLDAAKDEIDELPPLPFQPGNIGANYQSMLELASPGVFQSSGELKISNNIENWEASSVLIRPSILSSDVLWRTKSEEAAREEENERENWRERVKKHSNGSQKQVFSNIRCLPGMSYNVSNIHSHHMEASNLQSSLPGSHISTQAQDHLHNFNFMQLPPTFSLTTGSQIITCPPATQSYFPSQFEIDQRQVNHVQLMSSNSQNLFTNSLAPSLYPTSQSVRPFHFSMAPKLCASPDNGDDQPNKT